MSSESFDIPHSLQIHEEVFETGSGRKYPVVNKVFETKINILMMYFHELLIKDDINNTSFSRMGPISYRVTIHNGEKTF
jgi:hypothetical protein